MLLVSLPAFGQDRRPLPTPEEMKRSWDATVYILRNWGLPRHPRAPFTPSADATNAAARYAWLFPRLDPRLRRSAGFVNLDTDGLAIWENDESITANELERLLIQESAWIESLVAATVLTEFDMGLSEDPWAVYPALEDSRRGLTSGMLNASRVLCADAIRLWHIGDRDTATGRLAALIRLAAHAAKPPASSLQCASAGALLGRACGVAERLASNTASLTGAQRTTMLAALDRLDRGDPSGIRRSWRLERKYMAGFVRDQIADGRVGFLLQRALISLRNVEGLVAGLFAGIREGRDFAASIRSAAMEQLRSIWDTASEIDGLAVEDIGAALEQAESMCREADEIWEAPGAEERLREISDTTDSDQTGILKLVTGHVHIVHEWWRKSVECAAALRSRLVERGDPP